MIKKSKERTVPKEPYKVKNYYVTVHAVKRMNERHISKGQLYYNLTRKSLEVTKVKYDNQSRPSYRRSSKNKITSAINPYNKNVVSVNKLHTKDYLKLIKEQSEKRRKR